MRVSAISSAALALLLAACSSSAPTSTPEPAAEAPAPKTETAPAAPARSVALTTDEQKTIYAVGLSLNQTLSMYDLSPEELEIVKAALSDSAAGNPAVDLDSYRLKMDTLARSRQSRAAAKARERSRAYLATAAAEPGAVKKPSGLIYKELKAGTGSQPQATQRVRVHYRGKLVNGTEFDSSYKRGQPSEFGLDQVIPCWTEGLQMMKVGGKAQLVCPSEIAYKEQGTGSIPPGATLIFEVELLDIL
jgi:FKBP-type peptidyl-prolyl cis-trans isomerase FkpA